MPHLFALSQIMLIMNFVAQQKWYGGNDVRSFWEYIRMACNDVKNNCLKNVKSLEKPRTNQGKVKIIAPFQDVLCVDNY